jgi:hypothetical protein
MYSLGNYPNLVILQLIGLAIEIRRDNRILYDSPLEGWRGDGFELSVPGRESVNIMESGLLSRKRGGSVGEPKVRIHLPPAASLLRT